MTRGCLLGVLLLGAFIGVYYVALTPHLEWPGNAFAAGLGGLFALLFLSSIYGLFKAYRDARRLDATAGQTIGAFKDGEMVAVAGTIRPIDAPLTAPFSGSPCVAYDYDIVHVAHRSTSNGTETYEQHDISGLALTPSIIETPTGGVRLLSFAMLDEFPQQLQNGLEARNRATAYIAQTQFKPMSVTRVFSAFNALSEALTDEDGSVKMDWRMNAGQIELQSSTIRERLVMVGQQVTAVGKYSTDRRGLIAEGMTSLIQMRPGDAKSAQRAMKGKAWQAFGFSTLFFVVSHGIFGAMVYMSDTRYQREEPAQQESALRIAVQDKDAVKVRAVIKKGVNVNVRGSNNDTILHDLRDADMVRVLTQAGANPNLVNNDGWTPLMLAARMGLTDIVEALIDGGAQVNTARPDGSNALIDAIEGDHPETIAALEKHGATSDLVTASNGQPLPPDGGEPMQVVRGMIAGIHARDPKAIDAAFLPRKSDYANADWDFYHRTNPEKPVLLSGFTNGQTATLTVGGPMIYKPPFIWHFQLVRYKGEVWKIARQWYVEAAASPAEPVEQARPR